MLLLSLALMTVALSSCHDEEPMCIGYYISISSQEGCDEKTIEIIQAMQKSIRSAYPKPDTNGNDKAVIRACSDAYRFYKVEHPSYFDGGTTARLYRGWMQGTVFKSGSVIATWTL